MSGKGPTAAILGASKPSAQEVQLTRELGTANIGMGLAECLPSFPAGRCPAGLAGGVFLLIAGILHLPKKDRNAQETLATWTDLVVGIVVVVFGVYFLIHTLVG